jgi:hypothetical protein
MQTLKKAYKNIRKKKGIHIKASHKGRFTKWAKSKGLSVSAAIAKGKKSKNPAVRKEATFAANARKWKH